MVEFIISQEEINIMIQEDLKNSLLNYACRNGDINTVKQLINNVNIDITKFNTDYDAENTIYSPIEIACLNGHLEIVKYLVSIGWDPTEFNNESIILASYQGHLNIVKYLYSCGCDPTADDNKAIEHASEHGHIETVKYLYSIGCNPTVNNWAIMMASWNGYLEVVKFLALVGCETNVIEDLEMRKTAEYYKKYKPIMNRCITEIHGNPRLERTKTENENYFKENFNKY